MAFLHELPLLPGIILRYTDKETDRTVFYRINSIGFIENYYFYATVDSSMSTLLADGLISDNWNVANEPPMPAFPAKVILKDKSKLDNTILCEVVRDIIVDELLTPSI